MSPPLRFQTSPLILATIPFAVAPKLAGPILL